jgi:hypothetical protein
MYKNRNLFQVEIKCEIESIKKTFNARLGVPNRINSILLLNLSEEEKWKN